MTQVGILELKLDVRGDTPLYLQIIEQIQDGVARGRLQPGQQLPAVRVLAIELGITPGTVAKAYTDLEREGVIFARRGSGTFVAAQTENSQLAAMREARLWMIIGKASLEALSLGFPPAEIEAAFALHMARWRSAREKSESGEVIVNLTERHNSIVFKGSHDLTLDILASHVMRNDPRISLSITNVGSLGGLISLERGEAHLTGSHLLDEETGEYNVPFVKRLLPGEEVVLLTLAHRLQGLMVASGNPKGINSLEDLRRPDVRFVNRQRGAGTRVLLDFKLRHLGIRPEEVAGYEVEADTHLAVATAVSSGSADVGLGIYSAARSLGLDFVPLLKERYELVIPRRHYDSPLLKPLLNVVAEDEFREVVKAMGGYDTSETGRVRIVI